MCEDYTGKQKDREEAGSAASFEIDRGEAALRERYALSMERFLSFSGETVAPSARGYFEALRAYIVLCDESVRLMRYDRETNARIFYEESEAGYADSFLNPAYAKKMLGDLYAPLCVWYYELRGLYALLTDGRISECAALLRPVCSCLVRLRKHFRRRRADFRSRRCLRIFCSSIFMTIRRNGRSSRLPRNMRRGKAGRSVL